VIWDDAARLSLSSGGHRVGSRRGAADRVGVSRAQAEWMSAHQASPVRRMAAHRTRPHRPAQRTPAIVADRVPQPASWPLSQLIPLAARQAGAQHVGAHSLIILGFAIQNALEDEGIGIATGADITSAGAAPPAVRSRSRQRGSGTWS
jgi:hypothetical protein